MFLLSNKLQLIVMLVFLVYCAYLTKWFLPRTLTTVFLLAGNFIVL